MFINDLVNELVNTLVSQFGTSDPVKICGILGIIVCGWHFDNDVDGLYHPTKKHKFIFFNNKLNPRKRIYTIARELAHVVLFSKTSATFTTDCANMEGAKEMELQKHQLATCLLLHSIDSSKYSSTQEMLDELGIPETMKQFL